jgi:hypothetical protein
MWNVVMVSCLVLASLHLYMHKQEYLNDIYHLLARF